MRIPSRGLCAVNALADLAARQSDKPVSLASIAARQGISLSYLEQVFAKLRGADLVRSVRGPGGGYRLARPANQITIADVCSVFRQDSTGEANGEVHGQFWSNMQALLDSLLARISLADVIDQQAVPTIRALAAE
ncbi:MAG: Rrf2 family transcriptional regulator [Rhodobacteraceae bacterium]|nr:Rrf2 family transcriptional regulator [Paracoccaceae bacterium]